MSIRKHYMTLCLRGNTEVTHIIKSGRLEVTFEQATKGGFNTLVVLDDCTIVSNTGFNDSEISFYIQFLKNNIDVMWKEAKGLL